MSKKILLTFRNVEYTYISPYGVVSKRNDNEGISKFSEGRRHRRKPRLLDVTRYTITTHDLGQERLDVVIRSGSSSRSYLGIPRDAAIGSFCNSTTDEKVETGLNRLAAALGKMAGSDFNFGETLIELDQSFSMVRNRLQRLYLYFLYAKQGNIKGLRQLLKSSDFKLRGATPKKRLANAYLEYNFGWSPLINDVYNAVVNSHKILTVDGALLRRSSGRQLPTYHKDFWSTDTSRAGASGYIKNVRLSVANQLGITNPLLMAWNRLPFSFLVDWVVPISSYLAALTWDAGLTGEFAYRTQVTKKRRRITKVTYPKDTPFFEVGDIGRFSEIRERIPVYDRFVTPDLSSNHFQASVGKIATIGALFTQLNSR